jgi:hypothetical protein
MTFARRVIVTSQPTPPGGDAGSLISVPLEGVFDSCAAARLREAVASLPRRVRICLDFSHVRHWHDSAMAMLAEILDGDADRRLVMRGLGRHQRRLLKYLRLDQQADEQLAVEL